MIKETVLENRFVGIRVIAEHLNISRSTQHILVSVLSRKLNWGQMT